MTRRDVLRAASLPASWMAFSSAVKGAGTGGSDQFWRMVKAQFPLEEGLLYLNAANVCPASRPVMDRHLQYLRDFHANPSFQNREKYFAMRESLRGKLAGMLRVSADEVAITRNTSEGSNIVVQGLDLKAGDEVIITEHNHPSNNDSWKVRAKREGFVVKAVPTPVPATSPEALYDGIEKTITPKTRVIAITHVTSTTGVKYPIVEVGKLARRKNIYYHLDGAQTFGALDINLADIGCDSFSTSAHKWPMGPLEAGVLVVREQRIPGLWPSIVTAGWTDHLKGARKFEVFGQRDDPRVAALEAAVDFLEMVGPKVIEDRVMTLALRAKTQLTQIGAVEMKTSLDPRLAGGVIKFRMKNRPTKEAYQILYEKYRLAIAMTASGDAEGLRFSPHIYNSPEEIDRATAAVKALA